ncbi:MAG TPA: hypothetical protein VJX69_06245 [Terriglobales bacterium]|nr:hypothetical protein [Terriglobales bacterium]
MKSAKLHTKGFTLIASLLMLLLLSGIAIGLMMMVNTEGKVGGSDLQNNAAFRSAEGGIEKMTADLATTFKNAQAPAASDICNVGLPNTTGPAIAGITWKDYQVQPAPGLLGAACPTQLQFQTYLTANKDWGTVLSGPNQGLYAQIIPIGMQATAMFPGGQEVSMIRNAQVALVPVFQFGVFSESDLAFFPGAAMTFAGPVHTNGDLYPFGKANVIFQGQLSAYGNVIRTVLPNGSNANAGGYTGTVYIPTANSTTACNPTTTSCKAMDAPTAASYGDGSVQGAGGNPPVSTYNGTNAWNTFSKTTTNHEIINGNYGSTVNPGTGATQLSMPFVNGTTHPYEIIRRPSAGEDPTSALGQSREYNLAQIHVLLSDDPNDLPGGASDSQNVRLANLTAAQAQAQSGNAAATANLQWGVSISAANLPATFGAPTASNTFNLYFAAASNVRPSACTSSTAASCLMDWPYAPYPPTGNPSPTLQGLQPANPTPAAVGAVDAPAYEIPASGAAALVTGLCPPYSASFTINATVPTGCPTTAAPAYPYYAPPNQMGANLFSSASASAWSLIDGYLRVEYKDASGVWHPITTEWLGLGFARGLTPPTAPGTNPITPNAILLLQEPTDRAGTGVWPTTAQIDGVAPVCNPAAGSGTPKKCTLWNGTVPLLTADLAATAANISKDAAGISADWAFGLTPTAPVASPASAATPQSLTQYNWYPINFYDAREGENRDNSQAAGDDSCTTNGVMNAVEIDVGNLKKWFAAAGGSGPSVDYLAQNGYVLYFSDRRGMLLNPHPPMGGAAAKSGDSGLEDVINASSAAGTPNGALEPPVANSPEDDNQNGFLDNFGPANMGMGFWNDSTHNLNKLINTPANPDPFGTAAGSARITDCMDTARKNWVSGARHVLRLVDGSLGNVPIRTDANATLDSPGGFTVASENPVYILGDYNSSAADSAGWAGDTTAFAGDVAGHAAAAVIADTVTLLSNAWTDLESMQTGDVTIKTNRNAANTAYRVAVSAGKNRTFPYSTATTWAVYATEPDIGTDGGVHNFLRFLEDWSGITASYKGSLVSLYYSTYNTGFYKYGNVVYDAPNRNYYFDLDFTSPGGLPPGTPLFRDVETLGYRQMFTTRTY